MADGSNTNIQIEGMSCASCVLRVERVLNELPEVTEAKVNLANESAHVGLKDGADLTSVASALEAVATRPFPKPSYWRWKA